MRTIIIIICLAAIYQDGRPSPWIIICLAIASQVLEISRARLEKTAKK